MDIVCTNLQKILPALFRSLNIQPMFLQNVGRDTSVGIAIRSWLDGPDVDFR